MGGRSRCTKRNGSDIVANIGTTREFTASNLTGLETVIALLMMKSCRILLKINLSVNSIIRLDLHKLISQIDARKLNFVIRFVCV